MALQGTLDTFALPDVLRLLATTAKTGRLRIEGDRGTGSVWLRDGTVMAATADRAVDDAPAEEVLFELLRFEDGSFSFDMDELSPDGEQPEDVEVLLRNAGALLSEWGELETVVPSLGHRVALVESLPSDGVTIAASRWPTLVAIGAGRSVGDLGQAMGMGELSVSRAVRDLVDLGVIGIEPPGPADVPPAPPTDDRRTALPRSDSPVRDVPPSRPDVAPREVARRGPFGNLGSGDTLGTAGAVHDGDAMTTAEMQRAGWLQSPERPSGSTPAVPDDGGPVVPDDLTPAPSNGANGTSGGAVSMTRPPAPPGASTSRFSGRSASPGKRPSPRPGASKRPPSTNGRSSTPGRRSSGPLGAGSGIGRERTSASSPELPSGGAPAEPRRGSTRPPVPPRRRGPRLTPPTFEPGGLSTPPPGFDSGPLMPAPPPADTGQIRPVSPASLPPDLHWAADDASGLGSSGLGSGPGNGLALGGPAVPPPVPIDPSKVAPHVAALSPEARAAVQATAGNSGGSTGPASGDDVADRGQLLNFLSSVRP